jgi:hypothetical protein
MNVKLGREFKAPGESGPETKTVIYTPTDELKEVVAAERKRSAAQNAQERKETAAKLVKAELKVNPDTLALVLKFKGEVSVLERSVDSLTERNDRMLMDLEMARAKLLSAQESHEDGMNQQTEEISEEFDNVIQFPTQAKPEPAPSGFFSRMKSWFSGVPAKKEIPKGTLTEYDRANKGELRHQADFARDREMTDLAESAGAALDTKMKNNGFRLRVARGKLKEANARGAWFFTKNRLTREVERLKGEERELTTLINIRDSQKNDSDANQAVAAK